MFWLFIVMLGILLWTLVSRSGQSTREEEPGYSEFMAQVDRGNVKDVVMYLSPTSYELEGEWREPSKKFRTTIFKESAPDLAKTLREKNVLITVKEATRADWVTFLLNAAPLFLLVAFWIFMMRQMQAGGNKALSFGKSRARIAGVADMNVCSARVNRMCFIEHHVRGVVEERVNYAALLDEKRVYSTLLQLDSTREAGGSRTHHHDIQMLHRQSIPSTLL